MQFIYKITNIQNNKIYVGSTTGPKIRWTQHKNKAFDTTQGNKQYGYPIYQDMRAIGLENFTFDVIHDIEENEKCHEVEYKYILKYDSIREGYNQRVPIELPIGEQHHNSRITYEDVGFIRDMLLNSEDTYEEIASYFDIKYTIVGYINRGDTWRVRGVQYPIRETGRKNKLIREDAAKKRIDRKSRNEDIIQMRSDKINLKEIAKKYDISVSTVSRVARGER